MTSCQIRKQTYADIIIENGNHFKGTFIPFYPTIIHSDTTERIQYNQIVKDLSKLEFRNDGTCQITRPTGAVEGGPITMLLERKYGIKNDTLYIRQPDYYERYWISKSKDTLLAVSMTFYNGKKYVRAVAEDF